RNAVRIQPAKQTIVNPAAKSRGIWTCCGRIGPTSIRKRHGRDGFHYSPCPEQILPEGLSKKSSARRPPCGPLAAGRHHGSSKETGTYWTDGRRVGGCG